MAGTALKRLMAEYKRESGQRRGRIVLGLTPRAAPSDRILFGARGVGGRRPGRGGGGGGAARGPPPVQPAHVPVPRPPRLHVPRLLPGSARPPGLSPRLCRNTWAGGLGGTGVFEVRLWKKVWDQGWSRCPL